MDTFGTLNLWFLVFVLAALTEYLVITFVRKTRYAVREVATSIFISVTGRLIKSIADFPIVFIAFWVYQYRLMDLSLRDWWNWPLLFFATEFAYYWEHRVSHRCRWLWAHHRVHHSVQQLNLPAAVRVGWFVLPSGLWLFFLPLMWFGFHPAAVFTAYTANLAFQFILHTDQIPKIRFLEGILNTPSAHRVHHAINDVYVDKNFGGVLLIFDRIFSTYEAERADEPCRYGLKDAVNSSQNPLVVLFEEWVAIGRDLIRPGSIVQRLRRAFGPPGRGRPPPGLAASSAARQAPLEQSHHISQEGST